MMMIENYRENYLKDLKKNALNKFGKNNLPDKFSLNFDLEETSGSWKSDYIFEAISVVNITSTKLNNS